MKTLNEKPRRTSLMIICLLVTTFGFMMSFAALSPAPEGKFKQQSQTVRDDLTSVALHRDVIQTKKENLKESQKANDRTATIAAKKELCQAKADLRHDKAYLKADKTALAQLHKSEMKETCTALKEDKGELRTAKRHVRADLRQGSSCLTEDARTVATNQKEVNQNEFALSRQQAAFDKEMAALDEDLDKANGRGIYATNDSPREKARDWFGVGLVDETPTAQK